MQLKSVFFSRALANRSFRGIHVCAAAAVSVLLLSTALLLASCAHAVNTRGGEVKGSGSSSGSSGGTAGGGSANGTAPGFVVGADAASYSVGTRIDYSSTAGSSGGLGYVTVTPLPSGTLFTERQSGFAVSWTTYSVTVTINGTAFPVSFSAGDTSAVVIENVPVGATLSATAAIGVTSSDTLSYSSLNAATSAASTIQRGSNSITLWVQYPLSCVMSSGPAGQGASVTGTVPAYYTNGSPTTLPAATPSYTDSSLGCAMYFQGWSLEDGGTVAISAGSPLPADGTYKGSLTLYAVYAENALPISVTADKTVLTAGAADADLTATLTISSATLVPMVTDCSSQLSTDPPVQSPSDPSAYTMEVHIAGMTSPVWYEDDTPASVTVKVGTQTRVVNFTLKNKYSYYLKNHAGQGGSIVRGPVAAGGTVAFAAAVSTVAAYSTPVPEERSIVAFKDTATGTTYTHLDFPITFNSTNFSSRSVTLQAVLDFDMSVSGGLGDSGGHLGTADDPYVIDYNSTSVTDRMSVSVAVTENLGSVIALTNAGGKLNVTAGANPTITINKSALSASDVPAAGLTYAVTVKDYKTGTSDSNPANVYAEKTFYVKIVRIPFRLDTTSTAPSLIAGSTADDAETSVTVEGIGSEPVLSASPSGLVTLSSYQQNASDYIVTMTIASSGGNQVWFDDDTDVTVTISDGSYSQTVGLTLQNKYTYTLRNHSSNASLYSTSVDAGTELDFATAAGYVTSVPAGRAVIAFKDTAADTLYKQSDFPITFDSTNFSSRSINLKAVLGFAVTVTPSSYAPSGVTQDGTVTNPYLLRLYGAAAEKTLSISASNLLGELRVRTGNTNVFDISGTSSYSVTIRSTLDADSVASVPYEIKVRDVVSSTAQTEAAENTAANKYAEKSVYIKIILDIGSKASPDAVGDIVFSDGSASAYTDTLTDDQKNAAVAVIFDAANKKGVGLNVGTSKCWCVEGTIAYPVRTYATSFDDGKANTNQIAGLSDYSAANYPAFDYCRSYSVPGFTSGWYLPARNELLSLRTNKTAVEAALTSLGKTSPFVMDQMYFSSTNNDSNVTPSYGTFVELLYDTSDPTAYGAYGSTPKRNTACNVVAVRTFD